MPSAKSAMYTALKQDAGILAIVGKKVYPDQAPQTDGVDAVEEPYLIFQMVSSVQRVSLSGTLIDIGDFRFQITGYCSSRSEAEALEAAVMKLLHGDKGSRAKLNTSFGGLTVKASIASQEEGSVDEDEAPRPGEEFGLRVFRVDVRWFV